MLSIVLFQMIPQHHTASPSGNLLNDLAFSDCAMWKAAPARGILFFRGTRYELDFT